MADFDQAIRLDPKNAEAYLLRASVRGQKGEFDQAIADFTADHQARIPRSPLAYEARGTGWRHMKEYDRAIADFNEAIRLDPEATRGPISPAASPGAISGRTTRPSPTSTRRSQLDPAEPRRLRRVAAMPGPTRKTTTRRSPILRGSFRLDPRNAWAYASRGLAEAERQQYDKAVADLDQALQLEPDNPDALNGRAWFRATCPVAKYRDGAQAIAAATGPAR